MQSLLLFGLALLPGCVGFLYYYRKDELNREPLRLLAYAFFLGMVAVFPAGLLEAWIWPEEPRDLTESVMQAFLVVSPVEEVARLLVILWITLRTVHFDEVVDGAVYGAVVAAGFATLENIFYVMEHGFAVGFLRAALSVPMHIFCGVLIGHGVARYKLSGRPGVFFSLFFLAVFCHGAFDAPLLYGDSPGVFIVLPVFVVLGLAFVSAGILRSALAADGLRLQELPGRQDSWPARLLRVAFLSLFLLTSVGGLFMLSGAGLMYKDGDEGSGWALGIGLILLTLSLLPLLWKRAQDRLTRSL
ncbi:MAG: PrsW family intramembrane metalloprotease [Spirochaetales bacterium]|nr:PrsW family intramembrane metalloprotease [Spirochaetales bacterium]